MPAATNLLVALHRTGERWGIAWLELSSGRFSVLEIDGEADMLAEIHRLQPAELLIAESLDLSPSLTERRGLKRQNDWHFDLETANRLLCDQFEVADLRGFGCHPPRNRTSRRRRAGRLRQGHPALPVAPCHRAERREP